MEDLVKKIGHRIGEVSDRAVRSLYSKLSSGLATILEILEIDEGKVAALLLHWINERQSQADIQTLNSGLKLCLEISQSAEGYNSLIDLQAVEFFNSYYKYVPTSLQSTVTSILNTLISPSFTPTPKDNTDIIPAPPLDHIPKPKLQLPSPNETIIDPCEFPPVLLCESDEKIIFDINVTIKFGNSPEMIDACKELELRVVKDFPVYCLLQHADLIKSLVSLVRVSTQKKVFEVSSAALDVLKGIIRKLRYYNARIARPESRPVGQVPKKIITKNEYLEISVPCLKNEPWELGTPGPTLSSLSAIEYILTEVPMDTFQVLSSVLDIWKESNWAFSSLFKYPKIISKILDQLSSNIFYHTEKSNTMDYPESNLYIKHMINIAAKILLMLPPKQISSCITKNSSISNYLADFLIFQGEKCEELLPYLEEIDPNMVAQYKYAEKCIKALENYKTMKQILLCEKVLPIANLSVFHKALEFFENTMPVLEFENNSKIPSAVLDLNCYSLYLEINSTVDPKKAECQGLLLGLLSSTIPSVVLSTLDAILDGLSTDTPLFGLASGTSRKELLKKVVQQAEVLSILIIKHQNLRIIMKVMENPEDYSLLLPYYTILQSISDDSFESILYLITLSTPAIQPLRFIRDLFSKNNSRRAIASIVLKNTNTPEGIQSEWKSVQNNVWDKDSADPLSGLSSNPELDSTPVPKNTLNQEEIINLLNIYRSTTLEINLKVSAAEQIILHLLAGIEYENIIEEVINSACNSLENDTDDRYIKRLISKSLQILVLIALKYQSKAKKIYMASVKFVCSLVPYVFSSYDQIRHYSMYLLFVLVFSAHTPRNKFVQAEVFTLVPQGNDKQYTVPILSSLCAGFHTPFPVQVLVPEFYPGSSFLKYWECVPSSPRVRNYVLKKKALQIDSDVVLDSWGKKLSLAENHQQMYEICHSWASLISVSDSPDLTARFLSTKSELLGCLLGILRVPPTNSTEDQLHISLQKALNSIISVPCASKPYLEFVQAVSHTLQKSCIPFLSDLSEIASRKPLIISILTLLQSSLPYHGNNITPDTVLIALTKFQLEPGPSSLISVLYNILSNIDDITLVESILKTLIVIIDHPQLLVTLDIKTSPVCQTQIKQIIKLGISKIVTVTNPTTFVYKSAAKCLLQLVNRIPELVELDSYMWTIRLTEDRDAEVRLLAWSFLCLKSMESYTLHSSVLDISLEVVFGLADCFGVKTQAAKYLCSLVEVLLNTEDHPHKQSILTSLYQFGVISYIKQMLYDNSGPPEYFGILITLLHSLLLMDTKKVLSICLQIDIWDAILRLLRPGSLIERSENETRKPYKGLFVIEYEEVLISLSSLLGFITNVIRIDIQILDYLLESSHLLGYCVSWIEEILSKFDHKVERAYSRGLLGVVNCVHMCVFKSSKAFKHLSEFSYQSVVKVLDCCRSKDLKLALARLMTSTLPSIPPEKSDGLVLHLISLYKDENSLSEQKDITKALTSLLLYDHDAKTVAISTGFQDYLLEQGLKTLNVIQNLEIQKKKKEEETNLSKDLIDIIVLYKMWAANSNPAKIILSSKDNKIGSLYRLLFNCWSMGLRKEELLKAILETICTVISGSEEAKKSCAVVQDNRQSLLSFIIQYISRPNSASETCFYLSLKVLGSLCSCKESRQLLIKSKYPQGLANRLVKEWNEIKNPEIVPSKSPFIIEFLATFAFFSEGQKVIGSIGGIVDILIEVLDRSYKSTISYEIVENSLLLLRNLSFCPANKLQIMANQQGLPIILSYISSPSQKPRLRKLASSALWALLYHYQKFKGILGKEQVLLELESVYKEVSRDAERVKDKETASDLKTVSENLNYILKICLNP